MKMINGDEVDVIFLGTGTIMFFYGAYLLFSRSSINMCSMETFRKDVSMNNGN